MSVLETEFYQECVLTVAYRLENDLFPDGCLLSVHQLFLHLWHLHTQATCSCQWQDSTPESPGSVEQAIQDMSVRFLPNLHATFTSLPVTVPCHDVCSVIPRLLQLIASTQEQLLSLEKMRDSLTTSGHRVTLLSTTELASSFLYMRSTYTVIACFLSEVIMHAPIALHDWSTSALTALIRILLSSHWLEPRFSGAFYHPLREQGSPWSMQGPCATQLQRKSNPFLVLILRAVSRLISMPIQYIPGKKHANPFLILILRLYSSASLQISANSCPWRPRSRPCVFPP